jgi:hypothetical protein
LRSARFLRSIKAIIYSVIDAHAGGDYLESRGVKTVVAAEMLKDLYFRLHAEAEFAILPEQFESLVESIREAVRGMLPSTINARTRGELLSRGKIRGLNRTDFGTSFGSSPTN